MKDYLHMFGGVLAAIVLLAAYAFAWNAVAKCYGAEISGLKEVNRLAADGVNTETLLVDEDGNVVGSKSTLLHAPQPYIPESGDEVVCQDCTFIVVTPADWARLTNAVVRLEKIAERRHASDCKTDAGRRIWHGDLVETRQTADRCGIVYTYADGYTYTEGGQKAKRNAPPAVRERKPSAKKPVKVEFDAPARLKAKREAEAAQPAAKQVNAVFTAGGGVKVEGK